jgi:hypothetical protein
MGGPRAPQGRGAAVLRLDGSHQARTPDGVPQRRRFNTEKKSRRGRGEEDWAALTSGRRCRRGRLGVDGGVAQAFPAATRLSLLRSGSFLNTDGLLSFPCDNGRGLRPWLVGGVLVLDLLLLGSTQRRRPLLPPSHGALTGEEERENPKGVGGLGTRVSASPFL